MAGMERLVVKIALAAAALVVPCMAGFAQMQWRQSNDSTQVQSLVDPATSDGIEIGVTGSAIIVRTPERVEVKVFTILGQLVSQATLNAGTSELKISSRGIYIVKIGDITQKIAL